MAMSHGDSQLFGCHFLAGIDGTSVCKETILLIEKEHVLGFTLFKRNFTDADSMIMLCRELSERARKSGYEIVLAVDQEGGRVFRLPEPFSKIPPMRTFGDYVEKTGDVSVIFELGRILGTEVLTAGFNLDFAPVADVDLNEKNPIIGDRSFSKYPAIVSLCARALSCGLMSVGVGTCLKHFPGHGDTSKDSHLELPVDQRPYSSLASHDLKPFIDAITLELAPAIMTAHVVYPQLDQTKPATLSPRIIAGLLREGLNYNGLVFSDDLFMKAIADHEGVIAASEEFFMAGGDVALVCKSPATCIEAIASLRSHFADNPLLQKNLVAGKMRIARFKKYLAACGTSTRSLHDITTQNRFRLNGILKKIS